MRILLASSNPHKLQEIREIFAALRRPDSKTIDLIGLDTLGRAIPEPNEDQPTFEGNAILKARYYAAAIDMTCLADDSGLEVDALGGEPGVNSARYANVHEGGRAVIDPANNRKLLDRLTGVAAAKRTARFVCTMALVTPPVRGGAVLATTRGTVEGRILLPEETTDPSQPWRGRGANGFGYDPLFFINAKGSTTAELSTEEKNAISHRGGAARMMWDRLQAMA